MLQREIQVQQVTRVVQNLDISKSAQNLKMVTRYEAPMNRFALSESLTNHKEVAVVKGNRLSAEYQGLDVTRETFKYQIDPKALPPTNVPAEAISAELNVKAVKLYL